MYYILADRLFGEQGARRIRHRVGRHTHDEPAHDLRAQR